MVKIISISLSDEHKKILDDMELSPSGLFKQKMEEVKEMSFNYQDKLRVREGAILKLNNHISELNQELEKYKEKYGILD